MEPNVPIKGNKTANILIVSVLIGTTLIGAYFAYNSFYRKDKGDKSKKNLKAV